MRVLFFGRLREAAGAAALECSPPAHVTTIAALRDWLSERDPALRDALYQAGVRVARDHSFCAFDAPVACASEIAFMSPLSGG